MNKLRITGDAASLLQVSSKAMQHAAVLVQDKQLSFGTAVQRANRKIGTNVTGASLRKHVARHGTSAQQRLGSTLKVDSAAEEQIVSIILLMLQMRLPTWKSIIKKLCLGLMSGTRYAAMFPNGTLTDSWLRQFYDRHRDKLKKSNARKH